MCREICICAALIDGLCCSCSGANTTSSVHLRESKNVSHSHVCSSSYMRFAAHKRGALQLKVLRAVVPKASGYQRKHYQQRTIDDQVSPCECISQLILFCFNSHWALAELCYLLNNCCYLTSIIIHFLQVQRTVLPSDNFLFTDVCFSKYLHIAYVSVMNSSTNCTFKHSGVEGR